MSSQTDYLCQEPQIVRVIAKRKARTACAGFSLDKLDDKLEAEGDVRIDLRVCIVDFCVAVIINAEESLRILTLNGNPR